MNPDFPRSPAKDPPVSISRGDLVNSTYLRFIASWLAEHAIQHNAGSLRRRMLLAAGELAGIANVISGESDK